MTCGGAGRLVAFRAFMPRCHSKQTESRQAPSSGVDGSQMTVAVTAGWMFPTLCYSTDCTMAPLAFVGGTPALLEVRAILGLRPAACLACPSQTASS